MSENKQVLTDDEIIERTYEGLDSLAGGMYQSADHLHFFGSRTEIISFARAIEAAVLSASAGEKKDAERLDWLDQQGVAYGFEHVLEGYRWELDGPFNTARDAIDAYMSAIKSNQEQSTNKEGE